MNQRYDVLDEPDIWKKSRWTKGMTVWMNRRYDGPDEPEVWSLDEPVYTRNFLISPINFPRFFAGGSPISLEYSGVALPPPSHTPPSPSVPHSGHLTNFTVSWGAQDVKMISMELDPNQGSLGVLHDPSYSPHQESIGSDHGGHLDQSTDSDGMCGDSKRKRKKPNFSNLGF